MPHPLSAPPPPAILTGRGTSFCGKGNTLHVAHICCRRGGGASGLSGKDRCRALHAKPSHPVPQIVGNNQKTTNQQNPYNRLRPQSWLDGGCVFQGKARKRLCTGFLLWGRIPKPGPTCPCTHTAPAPVFCVSCTSAVWGCWLSFGAGKAAEEPEAAGRRGGSAPLKHIWRERAMRREKAEEGQGWAQG